ncbi:SAM-dependent DNA methyltransferase [Escherichia coli O157:H7]|nr:SAM-dependent DNA methyltransferase [Escherichia coli O157:H7]
MLDGIQQHFPIHYVDVEVLTAFDIRFVVEIPIQQADNDPAELLAQYAKQQAEIQTLRNQLRDILGAALSGKEVN